MIPWFQWTTVYLGPVPLRVWGFFVALGMLLSMRLIWKYASSFHQKKEDMADLVFWMLVFGMIGARLFHVLFYEFSSYADDPARVFFIWEGGLSSFGGFFGAAFAFFWFLKRKNIRETLWPCIGDLLAFASVFGWIVGRIGCFMIHDHLGRPCNFFLAIGGPDQPRLDMAFLEILGLLPLAFLFFFSRKKHKPDGWFLGILFMYYGVLRFILDFFRATDIIGADARYAGLTPAQYFAILMAAVGLRVFFKKTNQQLTINN
ncbi:MAG: hypothetical protein A3C10_02475 [Candidatus Magasanikbacteria bacterium RIFCSPHIGHO2_02_FULL_48_18]|nr:MAG: hypothetical protein A3I74_00750 [Candidatus Magasanikbacteria bacterium RIFCSPLOWO2_02_FULL_47_16]OGH80024.1 MAG: hypothetical protein A3C10_02475 [Candidatus Magasanikbacteria bacterium RIFCSPHIGHO2_02_FULL_48_18]